ncbi:MAG: carboxylating nicotinate-nucleotide diphosphorylase [Bacteriovoracaceae bacterium]
MDALLQNALVPQIKQWLEEDDLTRNIFYMKSLPQHDVDLELKIKSDLILSGTDYFIAVFIALGVPASQFSKLSEFEGKKISKGEVISLGKVPFAIALTAERLALNLLAHGSSIATFTNLHVEKAREFGIEILDTRKTTPGLRALEKYSVRVGGGSNHRFGQSDVWMIKDNHKTCLGGLQKTYDFFKNQKTFYNNLVVEIHSMDELKEAINLGITHVMLDNFSPEDIKNAIAIKPANMTYEASGGIRIDNIDQYLINGLDAISMGALTNAAPRVDISLKFKS